MTREEIVNILKRECACIDQPDCRSDCCRCDNYIGATVMTECHREIIRLLSPKSPYTPKIKTGISVGICTVCGKNFNSKQNFCSFCGAQQDWGDE